MMREWPHTAKRQDVLGNPCPRANLEGRGGCISQCILTGGSVQTFSHYRQKGIRFNTVRLHCFLVGVGVEDVRGVVGVICIIVMW